MHSHFPNPADDLQVIGKPKIAIIAARFNQTIVDSLVKGAMEGLIKLGVAPEHIQVYRVPGAFELPLVAQNVAAHFDGCIALGAVIRGETPHFDFVAGECATGLMQVTLALNKPIIFGVLTTDTLKQAEDRAGANQDNKGLHAAISLIEMLNLLHEITS